MLDIRGLDVPQALNKPIKFNTQPNFKPKLASMLSLCLPWWMALIWPSWAPIMLFKCSVNGIPQRKLRPAIASIALVSSEMLYLPALHHPEYDSLDGYRDRVLLGKIDLTDAVAITNVVSE
ncbi:hypothetical protein CWI75_07820 [Kineobactrum sediminis]|uniref:Uncharacterized protein n=2 Tax=Kineobactrum sediminis TaxID=1905677 RepID=A0A2N5Y4I9_9GAMM|nr:hypothetical protein CWI75_07820 [Kineobactrum sediminis]